MKCLDSRLFRFRKHFDVFVEKERGPAHTWEYLAKKEQLWELCV